MQPINSSLSLHTYEWKGQFMVSVENEVQTLSRFDYTHSLIEELYWKAQVEERRKGFRDRVALPNLQCIKDFLETLKIEYLHLIRDQDYAFEFAKKIISAFQGKERKVDELTLELESIKDMLKDTQMALKEEKDQLVDFKHLSKQENEQRAEEIKQVIDELDSLQEEFDLEDFPQKSEVASADLD